MPSFCNDSSDQHPPMLEIALRLLTRAYNNRETCPYTSLNRFQFPLKDTESIGVLNPAIGRPELAMRAPKVASPDGVVRIHDAVLCLAKFNEIVSLEAREDKLVLSALNSSKSAYASFTFSHNVFFEEYNFNASRNGGQQSGEDVRDRFTCQMYNKALLSVFKSRQGDSQNKDTAIERCECYIQDQPDKTACRLIVKMVCRHGVVKTYKLSYESAEVMHALFNRNTTQNTWTISAVALRSFAEYFGPKTEQLDIFSENGKATFTSYTEKIMNGKDVLKQPLQTSIMIDCLDFEDFRVEEKLHIGISVKDFRAIVAHAETLKTSITAFYSRPTRPMQLSYQHRGMQCDFTLMTIGDDRGSSATTPSSSAPRQPSAAVSVERPSSRQPSALIVPVSDPPKVNMPPPAEPASRSFARDPPQSQRIQRPSPPPPKRSMNDDSLFLPSYEDEDREWGERNYDEEEDTVGWSASAYNNSRSFGNSRDGLAPAPRLEPYPAWPDDAKTRLAPTQRLSDVENLFDAE